MGLLHTLLTTTILGRGTPAWTPANLFPTGTEVGLFLDFSDISTLYTDQKFSTNISAIGDPVGGVIDKSQGLVLGTEKLTNGDFDTDLTGWTAAAGFSVSGGKLIGATVGDKIFQDAGITAGEVYRFTITGVVGEWGVRLGQDIANDYTITADGTYFITPGASYSTTDFRLRVNTAGSELASISVKKLSGNHLIQATAAARPIWTRHPKSGVRNLLDGSEDMITGWSNASVGAVTVTDLGAIGPNGKQAWNLTGDNVNSWWQKEVIASGQKEIGQTVTISFYAKTDDDTSSANPTLILYNPGGVDTTTIPMTGINSTWQRFTATATFTGTAGPVRFTTNCRMWDVQVSEPQFEYELSATDYQTRVSKYDVTEAGSDDCYGLTFDGVDDYLRTAANLDLSGTDEVTLTAGVYATTPTTERWIFAHNNNEIDNSLNLRAPPASGTGRYAFRVAGNVSVGKDETFPSHNVVTGISSLNDVDNANVCIVRVDGASGDVNAIAAAPTLFDTAIASLGASNTGGGTRLVGTIYGVTLTDYILDAEQLAALEAWTAARTPEVTLA